MIAVKIFGGLGNQLFQYSSAKALASKHNTELILDLSWFDAIEKNNTLRRYELSKFDISARQASLEERESYFLNFPNLKNIFKKKNRQWIYYIEKKYGFTDDFHSLPDNTYLKGYWQSYKFFESIRPILIKELTVLNTHTYEYKKLLEQLNSVNSVAIHIRRGDYVSNAKAAKFHGTCSMEYYLQAIKLLMEKVYCPEFFIFSDDINWVKANMNFGCHVNYIESTSPHHAEYDFGLMLQCKYFVIANSTYSWWPAWLNDGAGKIVVAPKNWFIKKIDTKSLFPDSWILL